MKILYITDLNPCQKEYGSGIRNASIVEGLKKAGHDLHVVQLLDRPDPGNLHALWRRAGIDNLYLLPRKKIFSMPELMRQGPQPGQRGEFGSLPALIRWIQPDAAWYFKKNAIRWGGLTALVPQVVDLDEVHWRFALRNLKLLRGRQKLIKLLKIIPIWIEDYWIASHAGVVVLSNAEEGRYLSGHKPVVAVPNSFEYPASLTLEERKKNRLIFYGLLSYFPNEDGMVWFVREIWPRIRVVCPEAQMDVVGSYAAGFVERMGPNEGITIRGLVPDLTPFIREASFLVVPLRLGGGTRVKILEAWAKGLPVVTTPVGIEGLGGRHEENALIANTSEGFAAECIKLLNNPEIGLSLARNGFQHGKANFGSESIVPRIDQVLQVLKK
jgi:glycosyltransferase involved in cell wall biosynthesis